MIGGSMKRSICPICNEFYEETNPMNHMCDRCYNYKGITTDYIKTHRNASIAEITLATGIPIKYIKKLVENSYILFKDPN